VSRALLVALLCHIPAALAAQLGELQIGVVGSYSPWDPHRGGTGLVVGVAPGRVMYVGLRWTYDFGNTGVVATPGGPAQVRTRTQVFAADLGVLIPKGSVEIVPSVSFGIVQFAQRSSSAGSSVFRGSKEFLAAPGLALQVSVAGVALIPELQYYITGRPPLLQPVQRGGVVASVRLVFLREIRRIRR